ncbi:pentapeptide repeat-containing protein [Nocardia farcinica]|uniref:pentapeptide repeat-containing protein n=1 Tax=Nocardia TaxID=1817 RepID=UPI00068888ED|nr:MULTISPECIES: pentapeptide repeat-containing protein [Nocardia]MBF6588424.1 pentapeptide repeat-containing protein [Nocardia farcinica]
MLVTRHTYRLLTAAAAAVMLTLGSGLAVAQPTSPPTTSPPSVGGLTQPVATVITGVLAVVAATIALIGVVLTRRQTEKHFAVSHRAEQVRGLRERYTTCAQQLGDDHATVRAAGVYALVALAKDWIALGHADTRTRLWSSWLRSGSNTDAPRSNDAQTCIDLLCSYLRSPWANVSSSGDEREVRMAGIRALSQFRQDGAREDLTYRSSDYKLDLSEADFSNLRFDSGVNLFGATLYRADLSMAEIHHADLRAANLVHANLVGAELQGAQLAGADLTSADLTSADLRQSNLTTAKLREAILSRANLTQANLSEANLSWSQLQEACLLRANLAGAELRGANLSGANLINADLTGANLTRATLTNAKLTGTKLARAKLEGHDIDGLKQAGAQFLEQGEVG